MDTPTEMTIEEQVIFEKLVNGRKEQKYRDLTREQYFVNLDTAMDYMETYRYNTSYREVQGGVIVRIIKKMIRKCLMFYVEPICQQQSNHNMAALSSVEGLKKICASLSRQNEKLTKENAQLKEEQEIIQRQMKQEINRLEEMIANIK